MISYVNLKKEMRRRHIFQKDVARVLGINDIVAIKKINAQISFTWEEAERLQLELFPSLEITYLFQIGSI